MNIDAITTNGTSPLRAPAKSATSSLAPESEAYPQTSMRVTKRRASS